ncbi:MAG: CoA-binding protein, partial [Nanoarchaeota archaeon]|nr:CoA-binding protein [Nanoarchaeota archaeon]
FISQSGALADSIIDWAIEAEYGFSAIISIGNQADLDTSDFIEWLGNDPHTKAIALYIEGLEDGRKFIEIAGRISKNKPIIVLKGGRTEKGQKAISSHTGSIAGSYRIYETAFKQYGIEIADNVEELFDLAKALANQPPCKKNSIAIITNAGGPGVLCADFCESRGVNLAELKDSTISKLDKSGKMHPAYSRQNPLDLVGDALPERYEAAINTLLSEDYISGMIIIQTLQTMTDPIKDAEIIIKAKKRFKDKPIVCAFMGGMFSRKGMELLETNKIPNYNDPKKAARAMKALIDRTKINGMK